ncbi:spore coat protein [Candidatus Collierbacteria bacterium RIFOXYB1_FULL_49_13]|uniref:glucose-1-phosphate thymidylyltransferase n=1 Tax=Candidatus Collierbacteria bacterium RIFOXYB1_FULL_49_13 TaxID=1817728 RepID=A0A1F5FF79_9BACT|nr:MAG: spore coat protein [Candidatus Collierbacteria bacterium RIFOXYB1_FULL_49_13]
MKGIVLAGGLGTRLRPLTLVTNKHLLPVYDQPMIYRPLETLVKAGIKEIMVVVGGPFAGDFVRVLKNGEDFGLTHLEYAYQEGEGGIAEALRLGESFADGKSITVILGDNCTDTDIGPQVHSFKYGAMVFLKKVPDPERFGVATIDGEFVTSIVEKPKNPTSDLVQTGLYIYDSSVFDRIRSLKRSSRGELEIADLNDGYAKEQLLRWAMLEGFWRDAGTIATLFEVNQYWANKER